MIHISFKTRVISLGLVHSVNLYSRKLHEYISHLKVLTSISQDLLKQIIRNQQQNTVCGCRFDNKVSSSIYLGGFTLKETSLKSKVPLAFPKNIRVIPWKLRTMKQSFSKEEKTLDLRRPLAKGGFLKEASDDDCF